ncbi:MAG: hypothetical protein P1P84_11225 [Deferrisomatales bacterium]|nr:hypothetical protein [Deferrisomatales bacterium]
MAVKTIQPQMEAAGSAPWSSFPAGLAAQHAGDAKRPSQRLQEVRASITSLQRLGAAAGLIRQQLCRQGGAL